MNRIVSAAIIALTGLFALAALLLPFIENQLNALRGGASTGGIQPILTVMILVVCVIVIWIDLQGNSTDAKVVASLGILVAMASVLRFLETAIPGPAGFSPIFVPIILAGYVFGPRFGFLMGSLTLFTSALITAGIGPWLPFQMLVAGWIGLTAGWLPKPPAQRAEIAALVIFGFIWGLLYGLLLNLFLWPFVTGDLVLVQGTDATLFIGLIEGLRRYAAFYMTTSLLWDLARGFGNGLLILAIGIPAVRIMVRFKDRISFQIV